MAKFSAPVQTGSEAHPASYTLGTGSFQGGEERPGHDADPSPPSSAVGHERVELYLYSPYGPYGLYRASVMYKGDLYLYMKYCLATVSGLHKSNQVVNMATIVLLRTEPKEGLSADQSNRDCRLLWLLSGLSHS